MRVNVTESYCGDQVFLSLSVSVSVSVSVSLSLSLSLSLSVDFTQMRDSRVMSYNWDCVPFLHFATCSYIGRVRPPFAAETLTRRFCVRPVAYDRP